MEVTKFNLWDNKKAIFLLITVFLVATLSCVTAIEHTDTQTNDTLVNTPTQQTNPATPLTTTEESQDLSTDQTNEEDYDADAIYLTKDNYEEYNGYEFEDNARIILNDSLEYIELYLTNNNMLIGKNNATLHHSFIDIYGDNNVIANITFNNSAVQIVGNDNILANCSFNSTDDNENLQTVVIDGQNNIVDNVNFTDYRNKIIDKENYRAIDSYGDNNSITNCGFDITYPALDINWEDGYEVECEATVMVIHGNNNTVKNNNIVVNESESKEYPYGTIYTMSLYGQNNLVDLNNIVMTGTIYLYGIHVYNDSNNITNNFILVDSIRYANGIAIESYANYNLLRNNTIIINTKNDTIDNEGLVDAAYGIMITEYDYHGGKYGKTNSGSSHNVIDGNTITGYSTNMYAIETFGGTSTTISNNNIDVAGSSTIGIATIGGLSQITNNNIRVVGDNNATHPSPDYLKPQTTGIYLYQGIGNTVSGNTITSDHGTGVTTENEESLTFSSNTLNVLNNAVGINVINAIGTTTINDNTIAGKMVTQILNILGQGDGIISQNNHVPAEQVPTTGNSTQENETIPPSEEDTNTTTPETNKTDTPDEDGDYGPKINPVEPTKPVEPEPQQNQTDEPDTNKTDEPDTNKTDEPKTNETEISEPEPQKNQTETPEPEPQKNQTETPEPEPQKNQTEIPETNQTNATTPTIIVDNQTVTDENQTQTSNETIVPEKVEEVNDTQSVINNTKTETNQTATAGEKPDADNGDEPEQSDDPTPTEPEPTEPEEPEQQEETQDTQTQDTRQETKASQTNSESSPAVVTNKKIYELTKKLPEEMVQPDILTQVLILLILGLALTYGFTKKT